MEMKPDLIEFRNRINEIPSELWNYNDIENHKVWNEIRTQANSLLDKMGEKNRTYNDSFTTIVVAGK